MILRLALALALLGGCSTQQLRALSVLDCRARALEPLLGSELAEEVAAEAAKGKVDPARLLLNLGVLPSELAAAADRWNACIPPAPLPTNLQDS